MLLVAKVHTLSATLCEPCAKTAMSEYQSKTAMQGWTSPRSLVFNPIYIASNFANRGRHKRKLRGD